MPPEENKKENSKIGKILHDIFEFGVLIKFIDGAWQTATGFALLFLSEKSIAKFVHLLAGRELIEDPTDAFLNFVFKSLENLSHNTQVFIALYILIHGLLNLFLAIQLYRERLWAYVFGISVMSALLVYQIHRIFLHHSLVLTLVSIFDVFFIFLTWREYRHKTTVPKQ